MVLPELAEIAVVELRPDPEPISNACGHIDAELGEGAAALTGVHGQPIVVVCVDKTLRCKSVDLHVAIKEFKVLRL